MPSRRESSRPKPKAFYALTCSFSDLYHAAESYPLERTLSLVRIRLLSTQDTSLSGPATLATLPNEIFQLIVDYVRVLEPEVASLAGVVDRLMEHEETVEPEAIEYDAFGIWLVDNHPGSKCYCEQAPYDYCQRCEFRMGNYSNRDRNEHWDEFLESDEYGKSLDKIREMSFETCFWPPERWYGPRYKLEWQEDLFDDVSISR